MRHLVFNKAIYSCLIVILTISCAEPEKSQSPNTDPTECTADWCAEGDGSVAGQEPQPESSEDTALDEDTASEWEEGSDSGGSEGFDENDGENSDNASDSGEEDTGLPKDSADPCGCAEEDFMMGWVLFGIPWIRKRKKSGNNKLQQQYGVLEIIDPLVSSFCCVMVFVLSVGAFRGL